MLPEYIILLLAASGWVAIASASSAAGVLTSPHRGLLQILPAPSPPVCIASSGKPCNEQVNLKPVCSRPYSIGLDATGNYVCYAPCRLLLGISGGVYTNATGQYCMACPQGWLWTGEVVPYNGGTVPKCIQCAQGCSWNPKVEPAPGQCIQDCRPPAFPPSFTVPVGPPPAPYGACCNATCPPNFPVFVTYNANAGVAVCQTTAAAGTPGFGTIRVFMQCKLRNKCDYKMNPQGSIKPRTYKPATCPPSPPTVLTSTDPSTGHLVCTKCNCPGSYPYIDGKAVKCTNYNGGTTSSCSTGYSQCGPYCVTAALAALLGGTPFSSATCYSNVVAYFNCGIQPCPPEVVPPNPTRK